MRPIVLFCLLAPACAGGIGTTGQMPEPPYEFNTPQIIAFAPAQLALGDRVQIIGKDFIDPQHGTLRLHFDGQFFAESGEQNPFQGDVALQFKNRGLAEFEFGPNIFFSRNGDQIGNFKGAVSVVSRLGASNGTGEERASDQLQVRVDVLPSIFVESLHSVDDNCQGVTRSTIANTNLALGVKTFGMGTASASSPIRFRFHFTSPQVVVQYVRNEWYNTWPIMPTAIGTAPDGDNMFEVESASYVYFDPKSVQRVVSVSPPVPIAQQTYTDVKMFRLATGAVSGAGGASVNFFVEADGNGMHAQRLVSLRVSNQGEILPYNGNIRLLDRYQPQQVSACFPGGDIGRDLSYTESQSESRTRSVSARWDIGISASLGLSVDGRRGDPLSFWSLGIGGSASATWSETFGIDVTQAVTSEHSISRNLQAHILPGFFGVCYRQTERLERTVDLVYHNACGASGVVGQAALTDWNFGFDIATGPNCPPPTNLPPAQQFGG